MYIYYVHYRTFTIHSLCVYYTLDWVYSTIYISYISLYSLQDFYDTFKPLEPDATDAHSLVEKLRLRGEDYDDKHLFVGKTRMLMKDELSRCARAISPCISCGEGWAGQGYDDRAWREDAAAPSRDPGDYSSYYTIYITLYILHYYIYSVHYTIYIQAPLGDDPVAY